MLKTSKGMLQVSHRHTDIILLILDFENSNNKNGIKEFTFRNFIRYLKLVKN